MGIVTKECFIYSSFVKHFYSSKSSLNYLWHTTGHCSSQNCCTLTCSYVLCTTLSFFFIRLENPFVAVELSGFLIPLNIKNCSFESGWLGLDLLLVIQLTLVWVILKLMPNHFFSLLTQKTGKKKATDTQPKQFLITRILFLPWKAFDVLLSAFCNITICLLICELSHTKRGKTYGQPNTFVD